MTETTFLRRVILKNYRSIATCDIDLEPLTFFVGPNGSGKSSFLDALRLVTDSLRTSLDHALRDRGGINEVRRRSAGHPTHFGIRLEFTLPDGDQGHYAFRVASRPGGGFRIQDEECVVAGFAGNGSISRFRVADGEVALSLPHVAPPATLDRLYLVTISGLEPFRTIYDALSRMGFYNLNPDRIRDLQGPDAGDVLNRDGDNLASVFDQITRTEPEIADRIIEYLGKIVPGIVGVDSRAIGPKETLEFRQEIVGSAYPWKFLASSMSDGTLRAFGILVALFQSARSNQNRVPIVGIEEPEIALHPAAAGVLLDSLRDASHFTQVIVTSHSPDLLDNEDIPPEAIRAIVANRGTTSIGPLTPQTRRILAEHLFTGGELLRQNRLEPDPAFVQAAASRQLRLFDEGRP